MNCFLENGDGNSEVDTNGEDSGNSNTEFGELLSKSI